ncbi:MAG TPA: GNAT family N-acetyltransferase, partial [Ktedonobacterales bacterium]|nr:GNAT family N-acetyltransferase [Ktedonobacterales bacterium]
MSQTPATQRLTPQQAPLAIAMISRAFFHDPFSVYLYPDEAERTRRLPLLWSIPVRYSARSGEVATTSADLTGVACWLPPDEKGIGVAYLLRSGILTSYLRMGTRARQRMVKAQAYLSQAHQRYMSEPHWYLWILGVEPACQGKGIGGALLRAGLAQADTAQMPCYLETMNGENVPLYEHFGFVVVGEGTIPGSD